MAEIFVEEDNGEISLIGHCYADVSEYKTEREQRWIEEDTKHWQLSYRKKRYRNKLTGEVYELKKYDLEKLIEDAIPWEDVKKELESKSSEFSSMNLPV